MSRPIPRPQAESCGAYRALQLARKAVELDPNLPEAHAVLGFVFTWTHQYDASIAEFERALALNLREGVCQLVQGWSEAPAALHMG